MCHSKVHTDSLSSQFMYPVLSTLWMMPNTGVNTRYGSCDIIRELHMDLCLREWIGKDHNNICVNAHRVSWEIPVHLVLEKRCSPLQTRLRLTLCTLKKEEVALTPVTVEIVSQDHPRVSPDVWMIIIIISRLSQKLKVIKLNCTLVAVVTLLTPFLAC